MVNEWCQCTSYNTLPPTVYCILLVLILDLFFFFYYKGSGIIDWLHDLSTMSNDSKALEMCWWLLLQLLNELSGSASSLRISTPVFPVEVHSLFSISERVTTALCISYMEKNKQYNLKVFHFCRLKNGQLGWFKITVVGSSFYMIFFTAFWEWC